jgi:hypothetical protein
MEASRSDPVDLKYFTVIETKASVLSEVGNPVATTPDGTNSCDIYKFYARGPEATGKAAIATGEIVADVFTLGLTEVVFAPVEAATKMISTRLSFATTRTTILFHSMSPIPT